MSDLTTEHIPTHTYDITVDTLIGPRHFVGAKAWATDNIGVVIVFADGRAVLPWSSIECVRFTEVPIAD